MKALVIVLAAFMMTACGNKQVEFKDVSDGSCTTTDTATGATIECDDGSKVDVKHGIDGKDGKDGLDGEKGDKGEKGDTGIAGAKGDKGDTGATGPKGDKGATGAKGAKGDTGPKGDTGATGAAGANGKDGVDGKDGKDGLDGSEILYGPNDPDNGLDGKDGDTFVNTTTNDVFKKIAGVWVLKTNIKGDDGLAGSDGKDGLDGADGKDGTDGLNGKDGADGVDGTNGTDGVDGKDGKDGKSCTLVGNKLVCEDGTELEINDGKDGKDGKDGLNGTNGTNGKDGKDGEDGVILSTVLTPVTGQCYNVAPGIWVENEGSHADVYDNDDCSHQGSVGQYYDNGAICNDISPYENSKDANGEICWIDNLKIEIEGTYSRMVIKVLNFN